MTTMVESPVALRHGRDLVSPELFERLVEFCADEYGLERGVADRVMDQAVAFLWVVGTTRATDMAPSKTVDPGWHTFMLHSQEYEEWCHKQFGYYVHHAPNSKVRTRGLMVDVVGRIKVHGFDVDERLWGTAADCNQPACCSDGPCC
ncbi:glycine-rich domain-containing protein [Streptomyces sp. NPDC059994]|uniref:glycine-rich domain-containing protein n=1 Tax=Streptomyces sp. NPDC059994 TaxID=3347029 RepID=UPI0036B79247